MEDDLRLALEATFDGTLKRYPKFKRIYESHSWEVDEPEWIYFQNTSR